MSAVLSTQEQWDAEWQKWYARYSKGYPQIGSWITRAFKLDGCSVLEIAAGSARESRYIARTAKTVTCTDFSRAAVALVAKDALPNMSCQQANAFQLPFEDLSFDFSFHKGFWVLFGKDQEIASLFLEQFRVTSNRMLALVHNALNRRLAAMFKQKAQQDPLFNVRFFTPLEIHRLIERCILENNLPASTRVHKQGGLGPLFKIRMPRSMQPLRDRLAVVIYKNLPWSRIDNVVLEVTRSRSEERGGGALKWSQGDR